MQQSLEDLTLALRVLGALTEKQHPKAEDVKALRDLAPDAAGMTVDESHHYHTYLPT
jgi:hypothetical protein